MVYRTLHLCALLQADWQARFIAQVEIQIKQKEVLKYKVKAQWATEDKMRDVLKLREWLA